MILREPDLRSEERKALDEQMANEPALVPPDLDPGQQPRTVEEFLSTLRSHPVAVIGIVENGVVRPLDPQVKFPEGSRVIVVTSGPA